MAQFETDVPKPLGEDEPEFLAPGSMRTPAVYVLFFVFICQYGLKGPAMQVQSNDISRGKRLNRQRREEQLIDHLAVCGTNGSLRLGC